MGYIQGEDEITEHCFLGAVSLFLYL